MNNLNKRIEYALQFKNLPEVIRKSNYTPAMFDDLISVIETLKERQDKCEEALKFYAAAPTLDALGGSYLVNDFGSRAKVALLSMQKLIPEIKKALKPVQIHSDDPKNCHICDLTAKLEV